MINVTFLEDGKEVASFPTTLEDFNNLIKESTDFSLKVIKSWEERNSVIANLLFLGLSGEEEVEARNLEYRVTGRMEEPVTLDIVEGNPTPRQPRRIFVQGAGIPRREVSAQEFQEMVEGELILGEGVRAEESSQEIPPGLHRRVTLRVSADALRCTEDEPSQSVFFGSHSGATSYSEVPSAVSGGGIGGERVMDELRRLGRSRPAGVPLSDPPSPIGGGYSLSQREADALRDMWQIVSAQRNRRN